MGRQVHQAVEFEVHVEDSPLHEESREGVYLGSGERGDRRRSERRRGRRGRRTPRWRCRRARTRSGSGPRAPGWPARWPWRSHPRRTAPGPGTIAAPPSRGRRHRRHRGASSTRTAALSAVPASHISRRRPSPTRTLALEIYRKKETLTLEREGGRETRLRFLLVERGNWGWWGSWREEREREGCRIMGGEIGGAR